MKRILIGFGTRPEIIKLFPIINELKKFPKKFDVATCYMQQQYELAEQMLSFFKLHVDFKICRSEANYSMISLFKLCPHIKEVFDRYKPDLVIVQGDTLSAFLLAITAKLLHIKVAHVEAGLRSFDNDNPFPEEILRILIDNIADYYFSPTHTSAENLNKLLNLPKNNIFVVGNTVLDSCKYVFDTDKSKFSFDDFFDSTKKCKNILITSHRRESFGKPLEQFCLAIKKLAKTGKYDFVWPVHSNPEVFNLVERFFEDTPNITLLAPLKYDFCLRILSACDLVITDSGGLQEEATFLGKPVLVIRKYTERVEGIAIGVAKLIKMTSKDIEAGIKYYKNFVFESKYRYIYGDGTAAVKIVNILKKVI